MLLNAIFLPLCFFYEKSSFEVSPFSAKKTNVVVLLKTYFQITIYPILKKAPFILMKKIEVYYRILFYKKRRKRKIGI